MSVLELFTEQQSLQRLGDDTQWQWLDNKLYRRLVFEDFVHAFGFITQIALLAEKANHHPEWANVYRTVDIYLTTHEVGGVSERDFTMQAAIDKLIR